jgi:hypothetical protein
VAASPPHQVSGDHAAEGRTRHHGSGGTLAVQAKPEHEVFAGQGNAWWGLDYRDGRESPRIVYCDEPGTEIRVAAADFESFLERLVEK